MSTMKDLYQSADFKSEKHVPVIDAEGSLKKGSALQVNINVGKEIPHPNTTEHHIAWVEVYFLPRGEKLPYQIGKFEFTSHGGSSQGPNTSTIYTQPMVTLVLKTEKSGTILAASCCNIHGLWENAKDITVE